MAIEIYQADAFTEKPFGGNPAAVCILPGPADPAWMQNVARDMNLSETAFLYGENGGYNLRWFTPTVEVEICGHATLASAHILWETGRVSRGEAIEFYTLSGVLTAAMQGDMIELDFPSEPENEAEAPSGIDRVPRREARLCRQEQVRLSRGSGVRGRGEGAQARLRAPRHYPGEGGDGHELHPTTPKYDFVCRFFGPASGIDEDPATGSAYCCLGPYWEKKLGKSEFLAYQASGRGGVIGVRVMGERVKLLGKAVTVFKGVMCV